MEYSVQVEKPSKILRKLKIKVPAKVVQTHIERGLVEVQRTAKLKGFRPGQVPIAVVKQYYGEDVKHRTFHQIIDESYKEALRAEKIRAVGSPQIETPEHKTGEGAHDHGLTEGQDLNFTATVEVMPELEVKSYTGLALSKGSDEVTEQDVELIIKNIADSQAQLIPVTGGLALSDGSTSSPPAQKGQFVDIAFSGGVVTESGIEEKAGMKGSRLLELGSNSLIEGFEDQVVGMRRGETKTFRIPFPKDYFEAEVAGKDAEFTVTVNEVKEKKLPEMTEEFVKGLGYESIADMKLKAREHLTREKKQEVETKLRSDLFKLLIDKNPFDVPSALVQAQTRALAQDVAQNLKQQGFNDEMIQQALSGEIESLKTRAENQVRASLLLEAIAKKESIAVSSDEVDAELKKMSESMQVEETKLREFYSKNPAKREDLEFRMREDKTIQQLISQAKIKKV